MQENLEVKRNMEQEVQRRNVTQSELKSQLQEIRNARAVEKQSNKVRQFPIGLTAFRYSWSRHCSYTSSSRTSSC